MSANFANLQLQSSAPGSPCNRELPESDGSVIRAFAVECRAWIPCVTSIIRAKSAARAKYKTWFSARDVGYKVQFGDFRVRRAPEYDNAKLIPDRCYGEDFARAINSQNAGSGRARSTTQQSTNLPT